MPSSLSSTPPEEIARRGDEIYEHHLRAELETSQRNRIVAIDIHTGDHAIADNALEAARSLRTQQPNAEIWLIRIGERALHRIGAGRKSLP